MLKNSRKKLIWTQIHSLMSAQKIYADSMNKKTWLLTIKQNGYFKNNKHPLLIC